MQIGRISWAPIIKMRVNDFDCNALYDLGASISVMPKKIYDMPPIYDDYNDSGLLVPPTDGVYSTRPLGTPRGRYDAYSSKFSLRKKPRFIEPGGAKKHVEG